MSRPSRLARRPSALLVAESVLVAAILGLSSALLAPGPLAAVDPTSSADPAPSPDVSTIPDPSAVLEPSPTVDSAPTPDPMPSPDPTTPSPDPTTPAEPTTPPEPGPLPAPSADPSPTTEPSATPEASPAASPGLHVDHVWVDTVDRRTGIDVPGALDGAGTRVSRGTLYVVRFQVVNDAEATVELRPRIEFGAGLAAESWTLVPVVNPVEGLALYSSSNVRRGEDPAVRPIPVDALRLSTSSDPAGSPVAGLAHAGVNPGPEVRLGPHAFTELAFTVRATADAAWLATYLVRLSNGDQPVAGSGVVRLTLRDRPPVVLSPGQRSGIAVPVPPPGALLTGGAAGTAPLTRITLVAPLAASFVTPHGPYSLTTDACAACHSAHSSEARLLLVEPDPQSTLCFTCHDGTGAIANIEAQYVDPSVPANDPSTGSYYSHPATALSNHTTGGDSTEFDGVLNRHSTCADCHSPHRADAGLSVETSVGWTASGALVGASGVAVTNGTAGTAPTYAWQTSSALEYQVCFKCHSGFTQLKAQAGGPSTWALDKGVELNPANASYHPIEAPGTNATAQMTRSLSGTSPYKLWTFTTASTIRCVSCHGDSRLANPASPPAAGARLAPHAVPNRGMLIAPLRDRVLKGASEAYAAVDFALCYVCHAEAPFVDGSESPRLDTRFPLHGYHITSIRAFTGSGGSIDTDGAGHGNALCAECHFRTHGTSYAVDDQPAWSRLVNFAPDVQPYQGADPRYAGQLLWNAATQTCTLTCHGVDHGAWSY